MTIDWRGFYPEARVVSSGPLEGRKIYQVELSGGKTPSTTLHVDAETGDILKQDASEMIEGIGSLPVTITFEDYREQHGLRIPFRIVSSNPANGKTVIDYETVEANLRLPPSAFVLK